jgi:hypothetical protein
MKEIKIGDLVSYVNEDDSFGLGHVIKIDFDNVSNPYLVQKLLTSDTEPYKQVNLVNEPTCRVGIESLVVKDGTLYKIVDFNTDENGSITSYILEGNGYTMTYEREEFTIFNPVFDTHEIDWDVVKEVKSDLVITTGSFVINPETNNVAVVISIEEEKNVCIVKDLVYDGYYEAFVDKLILIAEQNIRLVPGMKIIHDGCVGTFTCEKNGFLHTEEYPEGLIAADCEIFNPYFHDYEEKNGVKMLKLRDFVDTPLKSFNETLYYIGVDPFENVMENLGCNESSSIEMLKKKIEYKDFVKMAENDAKSYHKEGVTEKNEFEKDMASFLLDVGKELADNIKKFAIEDSISQGLKQSEGKLMVQELYWPFIEQMARVMTINKEKYPPKNYLKPMDKEELLAAAQRHQLSMWLGEEIDPTDGQPHAVKVATNMMMYYAQLKLYPNA